MRFESLLVHTVTSQSDQNYSLAFFFLFSSFLYMISLSICVFFTSPLVSASTDLAISSDDVVKNLNTILLILLLNNGRSVNAIGKTSDFL